MDLTVLGEMYVFRWNPYFEVISMLGISHKSSAIKQYIAWDAGFFAIIMYIDWCISGPFTIRVYFIRKDMTGIISGLSLVRKHMDSCRQFHTFLTGVLE